MSTSSSILCSSSLSGKTWFLKDTNARQALLLSQRLNLPEVVGQMLAQRGIELDEAQHFLDPTLRHFLPDPNHLKDMDKAVARVVTAVNASETIYLFGDYDVDGATSSALLRRYFEVIGVSCATYIPDRMKEGYGPNIPAFHKLAGQGAKLIITLDCGTAAHEPLAAAKEMGLDVIVLDHHLGGLPLPEAVAIVNPNRLDESSPCKDLAAVGVVFLFLVALQRTLREQGFFNGKSEPDLKQFLGLVALGTVCDVVPLVGLNRAFVTQGLKVIGQRQNLGLRTLCDIARLDEKPEAYHLGFILGPRINAGGRVGKSSLGSDLLAGSDPQVLQQIAIELDYLNSERQRIEKDVLAAALAAVDPNDGCIVISGDDWHVGVIGIVASRLVELYHRPVIVVSFATGEGKGSGRSIRGFSLGSAIVAAKNQGLIIGGGGHDMAAGLTLQADQLASFKAFLNEKFAQYLADAPLKGPSISVDGVINLDSVGESFYENLCGLSPYGMGNPEPKFLIRNVELYKPEKVGEDHIRLFAKTNDGRTLKMMAFRALKTAMGEALMARQDRRFSVVCRLKLNRWQGRSSVELVLEDVA